MTLKCATSGNTLGVITKRSLCFPFMSKDETGQFGKKRYDLLSSKLSF